MAVSSFDIVKANAYIGPVNKLFSGQAFYVNNSAVVAPGALGGSDGNNGLSPQQPFATLDFAVGSCTASRGDVIYVLPGHAENYSATSLAIDVAGISIVGIGQGSLRPSFTANATTSSIEVSAANVLIDNLLIRNGIDAVVRLLRVTAADVKIYNCEFRSVTGDAVISILTTAAADRLEVAGCRFTGTATATATAYIALVGNDEVKVHHCNFDGQASAGFVRCITTASTDLEVHDCMMRSRGAGEVFLLDTITASTAMVGPNIYCRLSANAANVTEAITGATFVVFDDVYVVNLANEKAMLINWVVTTDA